MRKEILRSLSYSQHLNHLNFRLLERPTEDNDVNLITKGKLWKNKIRRDEVTLTHYSFFIWSWPNVEQKANMVKWKPEQHEYLQSWLHYSRVMDLFKQKGGLVRIPLS